MLKQRKLIQLSVLSALVLTIAVAAFALPGRALAATSPTITLLNAPEDGVIVLAVGETYTFDIEVSSDTQFMSATATNSQYYPGRGISFHGTDMIRQDTSGVLHLTMTGKEPSDGAANVVDGVLPVSIVVGIRYPGGQLVTQQFDLSVIVTP